MPVQSTSRSRTVDSGGTDAQVVQFPQSGEPFKGLRELRIEHGWSQTGAVRALLACATDDEKRSLPAPQTLMRSWKRWEAGDIEPDGGRARPFYKPIIARMFGTTPEKIFPPRTADSRFPWPVTSNDFRKELESRRHVVYQTISKLQAELDYLDAVLSIPVPVTRG